MMHKTNAAFWQHYRALPPDICRAADKQFALLKANPNHASLKLKKIGVLSGKEVWSARVSLKHRALAFKDPQEYVWFWIGEHNVCNLLIRWDRQFRPKFDRWIACEPSTVRNYLRAP